MVDTDDVADVDLRMPDILDGRHTMSMSMSYALLRLSYALRHLRFWGACQERSWTAFYRQNGPGRDPPWWIPVRGGEEPNFWNCTVPIGLCQGGIFRGSWLLTGNPARTSEGSTGGLEGAPACLTGNPARTLEGAAVGLEGLCVGVGVLCWFAGGFGAESFRAARKSVTTEPRFGVLRGYFQS